jgi:hypothetical protein
MSLAYHVVFKGSSLFRGQKAIDRHAQSNRREACLRCRLERSANHLPRSGKYVWLLVVEAPVRRKKAGRGHALLRGTRAELTMVEKNETMDVPPWASLNSLNASPYVHAEKSPTFLSLIVVNET